MTFFNYWTLMRNMFDCNALLDGFPLMGIILWNKSWTIPKILKFKDCFYKHKNSLTLQLTLTWQAVLSFCINSCKRGKYCNLSHTDPRDIGMEQQFDKFCSQAYSSWDEADHTVHSQISLVIRILFGLLLQCTILLLLYLGLSNILWTITPFTWLISLTDSVAQCKPALEKDDLCQN
jgi:hypothetical protein